LVWNVITEEIPHLKTWLKEVYEKIPPDDGNLSGEEAVDQHPADEESNRGTGETEPQRIWSRENEENGF
jgi:hypothetical protein